MERKSFLQAIVAAIVWMVAGNSKAGELIPRGEPLRLRPLKPKLAPEGCARTFRQDADGQFYEIDRRQIKAGDVIVMIGINEKTGRLWKAHYLTVLEDFESNSDDPHGQVAIDDNCSCADLLSAADRLKMPTITS